MELFTHDIRISWGRCRMKTNTAVVIIIAALAILFIVVVGIAALSDDTVICRSRYTMEDGTVCKWYAKNDFGASHAKQCSDGSEYYNPKNVKVTKICDVVHALGDGGSK